MIGVVAGIFDALAKHPELQWQLGPAYGHAANRSWEAGLALGVADDIDRQLIVVARLS